MAPLIEQIDIRQYRIPLDPPFQAAWDPKPRRAFSSTVVRILAGDFEGVGSGEAMLGFRGHEDLFIGRDPFAIERHVRILDNLQFHYGRMWPLEIALWDLMGKISGKPIWQLLGGESGQVRLYASTGARLPAQQRAESALDLQRQGFTALKIRFHAANPDEDIAVARAVRQAVGPKMQLMVDANQGWRMPWDTSPGWDFKTARRVADALEELDVFWLEEPLHRHDYQGLASLRRVTKVRIAGGEGNREYNDFQAYLRHRSLDVYQPDVVWSTGILRARRLAAQVQDCGAVYSPHTWGDGLVVLANLQVAAAFSTAAFVEYPIDPPQWTPERRDFLLPQTLYPENGLLDLGTAPGLGVELDWSQLEPLRVTGGAEAPW